MIARVEPGMPCRIDALRLVGRGVWIETLRRKDAYVLFVLMIFYAGGILIAAVIGVENEATATFLLNLGLMFAWAASHVLTLTAAARQIPGEIEGRTIHPLLAKPLARRDYVLGKWLATAGSGVTALLIFLLLVGVSASVLPRGHSISIASLIQMTAMHSISIAMLGALAILGSLLLPRGLNLAVLAMLVAAGGKASALMAARANGTPLEAPARWIAAYIPNFDRLNLATRLTDGIGPLGLMETIGLAAYGAVFTAAALTLACAIFARKEL